MQIFGYPGDRVDFVSKSASAGSVCFGDPRHLVEEFFGPAHTSAPHEITYFSSSVAIHFDGEDRVAAITIRPGLSKRERVEIFVGKTRLSGANKEDIQREVKNREGQLDINFGEELTAVTFR